MNMPFPIDDFRVLGQIGKGEFGIVHNALWMPAGLEVALKQVAARAGARKMAAEREGAELQRAIARQHPTGVPAVHAHGLGADGDYYIAMEMIRGESLQRRFDRERRLDANDATRLARALAAFLRQLHGFRPGGPDTPVTPIVHCDLKPEHVLLLPDGTLRVIDFGIARRLIDGVAHGHAYVSLEFASPERLIDEALTVHPADDLWALGVIAFMMLAGEHPHQRLLGEIDDAHKRADITRLRQLLRAEPGRMPDSVSLQLQAVVLKMLASQPEHRYRAAAEIEADLRNYLEGRDTIARSEALAAGRATRLVPRRPVADVPTVPVVPIVPPPLPVTARAGTVWPADTRPAEARVHETSVRPAPVAAPPPVPRSVPLRRRRSFGSIVRLGLALVALLMLLGEMSAWTKASRYRAGLSSLALADVDNVPADLERLERGAPFAMGVRWLVSRPLAARLVELAEPTLADYRTERPRARSAQWQRAVKTLALAVQQRPGDDHIRALARYAEGQVARIAAQDATGTTKTTLLNRAIDRFRDAARLDSALADPYLALATIHAYADPDVDALQQDIDAAQARGYRPGRREYSELADAHRFRADQQRIAGGRATGDAKLDLLRRAGDDYQRCIQNNALAQGFFNADRNADYCTRRYDQVQQTLDELTSAEPQPEASPEPELAL